MHYSGPREKGFLHAGAAGREQDSNRLAHPAWRDEARAEGGLNAFRCTVSVRSVEESAKAIEEAGGTLRSPVISVPHVGRLVEFADPDGNVACVMQYTDGHALAVR